MHQSQQFHTSNYRGNQQGHDAYLRADSQSPSNYGNQNVTSQYRGLQKNFQPTGLVNSVYGQSNNTGFNQSNISSSNFGGSVGAQNYHTANYRGDQQGHDSYLRADSTQPSQSQFGGSNLGTSNFNPSFSSGLGNVGVSSFSSNQNMNQNYNQNQNQNYNQNLNQNFNQNQGQNQNQFVSPESFHNANYRGDQQGHDSYLRGDSSQPAQSQYSIGASGTTFGNVGTSSYNNVNANIGTSSFSGASNFGGSNLGVSSFGTSNYNNSTNYVPSNIGSSSFGTSVSSNQNTNQFISPESFHTASYKGNQDGHDSYLRADSRQPAQSQFGSGMTSGSVGSFNNNNRF